MIIEHHMTWIECWRAAHSDNADDLRTLVRHGSPRMSLPDLDPATLETIQGSRLGLRPLRPLNPLKTPRPWKIARPVPYAIRRASISTCQNFAYC